MSTHDREHWPAQRAQAAALVHALNGSLATVQTGAAWILEDASHSPDEWHCWRARRLSDDLRLAIEWYGAAARQPARLSIGLVWPVDAKLQPRVIRTPYKEADPVTSITVDASKAPAVIAKDVTRRLLPSATTLHTEARRLIALADEASRAQAVTVAAILAAEPGAHRSQNGGGSESTIYLGPTSHGYCVRVDSDTSIRFEPFSVDLPAALRILEALRKPVPVPEPHDDADPDGCACSACIDRLAAEL